MNSKAFAVFSIIFFLVAGAVRGGGVQYALFGAGRYHAENDLSPVAFEDGQWSVMGGIEFHEGPGYWQLAVDYADGGATGTVSSIITPQLNLNLKERGIIAGAGVLYSYIDDDETGSEWSDVYFQLNGGIDLPVSDSISLSGIAHFVFEDWGDLSKIDFNKLDYTVGVRYKF